MAESAQNPVQVVFPLATVTQYNRRHLALPYHSILMALATYNLLLTFFLLPPGVSISPNALGIVDFASGGSGNFLSTTGGRNTALTYKESDSIVLNINDGFTGQLSFKYSSPFFDGHQVKIYEGLNATGSQLISVPLARTNEGRGLIGAYNPFEPVTIPFNGTAKSIQIGSRADKLLIDDIQLAAGSAITPTPTPAPVTIPAQVTTAPTPLFADVS